MKGVVDVGQGFSLVQWYSAAVAAAVEEQEVCSEVEAEVALVTGYGPEVASEVAVEIGYGHEVAYEVAVVFAAAA